MNPEVTRYKLRTCIRKDTFCYKFNSNCFAQRIEGISLKYGEFSDWGNFNIKQIECECFIIRVFVNDNSVTLIQKTGFNKKLEREIHQIIGYENE